MIWLVAGLIGFLGAHMTRVVAEGWRGRMIARIGEGAWKGLYSLVSLASFALIVWGFSIARGDSAALWVSPAPLRAVTALLMLVSIILLAGAHIRRSHLTVWAGHPMLWGVAIFCVAHLLSNGRSVDLVLFGSLLVWSALDLVSCYGRGRSDVEPQARATAIHLGAGLLFYLVFVFYLHRLLIGVAPLGG